ncbi:hypothetical protein C8Q75DRAFT_400111 [Abortiporus biennis]|nr:hypothetical protein C8Q75DRAFT_400111 [Abortiporus biennis]
MNSFWSLLDWIFPSSPIRLSDDLDAHSNDPEAQASSIPGPRFSAIISSSATPSSYPPNRFANQPNQPQQVPVDRAVGGWDRQKERDRERDSRERERSKERERERQKEQEREKERHRTAAIERENVQLTQKIAKLEADLLAARQSISTLNLIASPSSPPSIISFPPSHSLDSVTLKPTYDTLYSTYSLTHRALFERTEEVASLKTFLSKTDDLSGAQLLQALRDLNAEIVQLAASVADEFATSLDRRVDVMRQSDKELVNSALGAGMLHLLASRDHRADPTLVQFAIQAWEVVCVGRVLDSFCFGVPPDVDQVFSKVFEHMHRTEAQATTSRWRALTHSHARALLSSSSSASPYQALNDTNLRGLLAILTVAGCTDPRGIHRDPLCDRFGPHLLRIAQRAERIACAIREGIMSASFDVLWLGYGKQNGDKRFGFDKGTMENVYAGHGSEKGGVLCTVEFGLICARKVTAAGVENESSSSGAEHEIVGMNGHCAPHTNGHSAHPNGHSNGHAHANGHGHRHPHQNGTSKTQPPPQPAISRSLLLKPKVLLDSIAELL